MRTAVFPGSFDPFTKGHADVVARGLYLFDKVVIAIGVNAAKTARYSVDQRKAQIEALYEGNDRVEVIVYEGLTVDLARKMGYRAMLRSARTSTDFEYERTLASVNGRLAPDVETVILPGKPELEAVQSSYVRELLSYGKDVSDFVPETICKML